MVEYIESQNLIEILLGDRDSVSIIDVRDDDEYEESHIKGAFHCPSHKWSEDDHYIEAFIQHHVRTSSPQKMLVFHCFKSQVRGPSCAEMLQQHLSLAEASDGALAPKILVLRKGFEAFWYRHKTEHNSLFEQAND